MMSIKHAIGLVKTLSLLIVLFATPVSACPARQFIAETASTLQTAAHQSDNNQFAALINHSVDLPEVTRFALGRYQNQLNSNNQSEYYAFASQRIAQLLAKNRAAIITSQITITNCQSTTKGLLVNAKISGSEINGALPVAILLKKSGSDYLIRDISIASLSLRDLLHQYVINKLDTDGGKISVLLDQSHK